MTCGQLHLRLLAGTAGTWFLLDYAYYGNTISTPQILGLISPHASTMERIALQLGIFVVAALPGYLLAIARMDRIGHRRLQLLGFAAMAVCFFIIAAVPGMTTTVAPFLIVYGVSYFFTEFGPNVTTFVIPSEVYPVDMRATGHGISAGVGKLGAFIGVFLFPVLQSSLGLRGTLLLTAAVSALGFALTRVLPEPSGASLEDFAHRPAPIAPAEPAAVARTPDATRTKLDPCAWCAVLNLRSSSRAEETSMTDTEPQTADAKVLWHFLMSLDGFVAGPNHEMDWMQGISIRPGLHAEYIETTGAVLAGRSGFDSAIGDSRPYGGAWQGPIFVLTHHPETARQAEGITVLSCPVEEAVHIALEAAGGKNVEVFSPTIGRQLLEKGLIDEIDLHIAPVLLGDGIRLYDNPASVPIRLHLVNGAPTSAVNVRYRPVITS